MPFGFLFSRFYVFLSCFHAVLCSFLLPDFDVKFALIMVDYCDYCGPPLPLPWDSYRVAVRSRDGVVV